VTAGDIAYTPREMETLRQLEAWWAYASRCAQLPASTRACDSFWTAAATAAVAVAALVALYIVRKMVRNFLAVRAERARTLERARVADPGTMARHKADVDKLFAVSPEDNVEQRIREALDERKLKDQWQRPGGGSRG
jgi:flagellar biosynthesis/type III secretory pathway M-ring protein FliF/YscJ